MPAKVSRKVAYPTSARRSASARVQGCMAGAAGFVIVVPVGGRKAEA
jgi:hypothetical protein